MYDTLKTKRPNYIVVASQSPLCRVICRLAAVRSWRDFWGACRILKGWENCHLSIWEGRKIRCQVEEMLAKAECIKGRQILA